MKTSDKNLRVGSKVQGWWSQAAPGNMATVMEVLPYRGHFTEFYDCVLRLTAPNTGRGWLEMSYNSRDFKHEPKE